MAKASKVAARQSRALEDIARRLARIEAQLGIVEETSQPEPKKRPSKKPEKQAEAEVPSEADEAEAPPEEGEADSQPEADEA